VRRQGAPGRGGGADEEGQGLEWVKRESASGPTLSEAQPRGMSAMTGLGMRPGGRSGGRRGIFWDSCCWWPCCRLAGAGARADRERAEPARAGSARRLLGQPRRRRRLAHRQHRAAPDPGAGTLRYKHQDHLVFAIVRSAYSRVGSGDDRAADHRQHLRAPALPLEAVAAASPPRRSAQHEYDQFRRLQLRALVGAGRASPSCRTRPRAWCFGVAYMLEQEQLGEKDGHHRRLATSTPRAGLSELSACSPARSTTWSPSSTRLLATALRRPERLSACSTRPSCR
jgi:hypothetical protein